MLTEHCADGTMGGFSYMVSESSAYDWSHHAGNGSKGVGDGKKNACIPTNTHTQCHMFSCQRQITHRQRKKSFKKDRESLRRRDVKVVDVETRRSHSTQRGGEGEEGDSQDIVTACVTCCHEKYGRQNHACGIHGLTIS